MLRRLARVRRDARRLAGEARALAGRGRCLLAPEAREDVERACAEVEAAAGEGEPERLSAARRALGAVWEQHLAPLRKPAWREYAEAVLAAAILALAVRAAAVEAFRIPSGSMAPTLIPGDLVLVSKLAYGPRVPFTGWRLLAPGEPRRGDVVVFESPRERGREVVKRVVGIPGDVVELREQVLYVNGVPQPRAPDGEVAYEERGGEDGADFAATCLRFREWLAKGALAPLESHDPAAAGASWEAAAAAGVASYTVLQCRRTRLASREGPYAVVAPGHVFVLGDNRDRSADSRAAGGWQVPLERVTGKAVLVLFRWGGETWSSAGAGPRLERLFKPVE